MSQINGELCRCLKCKQKIQDIINKPDYYVEAKSLSTVELKRKYLADKISNFEDKIIILSLDG